MTLPSCTKGPVWESEEGRALSGFRLGLALLRLSHFANKGQGRPTVRGRAASRTPRTLPTTVRPRRWHSQLPRRQRHHGARRLPGSVPEDHGERLLRRLRWAAVPQRHGRGAQHLDVQHTLHRPEPGVSDRLCSGAEVPRSESLAAYEERARRARSSFPPAAFRPARYRSSVSG